jgi:hypothetical protein
MLPTPYAEVKMHNGVPTVFVDGKPAFYDVIWMPTTDDKTADAVQRAVRACARRTGVHYYVIENGTSPFGYPAAPWIPGPRKGHDGHFDFSHVEQELRCFIDADPEARFHIRFFLEMNPEWVEDRWWSKLHPDECVVNSEGWQPEESFASTVFRGQVNDFLRKFIAHIDKIGLSDRVLAYQPNVGTTCEWFKYSLGVGDLCGDFSPPMVRFFQSWLRLRYAGDEKALRAAWRNDNVTFETATVPDKAQQHHAGHYILRDPAVDQQAIDYVTANAELCADVGIDFCKTIKDACQNRAMAGLFYGYWLGFQLNSDYFRERTDLPSAHTRLQRTGHLGLHRALHSKYVDFVTSPMDYGFRAIGGHCPAMQPVDAVNAHGKIYIQENDDRPWHPTSRDYGACRTVDEFISVYRRTLADAFTTGQGTWNTSIPFHVQRAEGINNEDPVGMSHSVIVKDLPGRECDRFVDEFAACRRVGEAALDMDRSPCAEICVLVDDKSFFHQTYLKNLELPLVEWQHVQGLPRLGAPHEIHILDDFLDGRLRPYKLYVFLNAFWLDDERRAKLKRELRREGRTAVWIYAGGVLNKDLSLDHMADVTGFRFAMTKTPWGPFMHVTDFDHPITRDVPEELFWGTDLNLSPTFYVQDPEARILGNVVHAQGRCAEGLAVKEFKDWRSVFIAAPNVPASVLRGLARYAGVHLYNEAGDMMLVCRELLSVHTLRGGERTFKLPQRVGMVYDMFRKQVVARDVDHFTVDLPKVSTSVFFTGPAARLSGFNL